MDMQNSFGTFRQPLAGFSERAFGTLVGLSLGADQGLNLAPQYIKDFWVGISGRAVEGPFRRRAINAQLARYRGKKPLAVNPLKL
jgi:hypothetical protein